MTPTKEKEKSLSKLIHELDGHFSRWIRTRDTVNGVIRCFICDTKLTFQEAQCMHFLDRDLIPTRYDERNCNSGCETCNCYDPEHKEKYARAMVNKYGTEELERLQRKAKGLQKFFRFEVQDLIEFYKSENRLKK